MSLSDAKAHLSEVAEEIDRTHERVLVTKNGRDYRVMSAADLEAIEATLELLADPAAQERIAHGRREIDDGLGMDRGTVERIVRSAGGHQPDHR
jgi:antitoxin YefM